MITGKKFVENVDLELSKIGMTRAELCRKVGIGKSSFRNWLVHNNLPKVEIVTAISQVLAVPVSTICPELEPNEPPLDAEHRELIELYDGADEVSRRNALAILRDSYEREKRAVLSAQNMAGA